MSRVSKFEQVSSDFELLDVIRQRHQMYAQNLDTLFGIIVGFNLACSELRRDDLEGFTRFIRQKKQKRYGHWVDLIRQEAQRPEYEISIFFEYLDEYRNIEHEVLHAIELTREQRCFSFHKHLRFANMDYFEAPLDPPHTIKIIRLPNGNLHVFGLDKQGKKFYEHPRMSDLDYIKKWLKDCYDISL